MATPAAKTTTTAATLTWGTANPGKGWSTSTSTFSSADKTLATKWAAAAGKFSCTKMLKATDAATTDCNAKLGIMTGGCCYAVVGTGPTKAFTSTTKTTADVIDAVWPINKGTKYLCATADSLAATQGWTAAAANENGTAGSVDASKKFANKGKSKSSLAGSVATWTCSGATALAATGAAATALISLM